MASDQRPAATLVPSDDDYSTPTMLDPGKFEGKAQSLGSRTPLLDRTNLTRSNKNSRLSISSASSFLGGVRRAKTAFVNASISSYFYESRVDRRTVTPSCSSADLKQSPGDDDVECLVECTPADQEHNKSSATEEVFSLGDVQPCGSADALRIAKRSARRNSGLRISESGNMIEAAATVAAVEQKKERDDEAMIVEGVGHTRLFIGQNEHTNLASLLSNRPQSQSTFDSPNCRKRPSVDGAIEDAFHTLDDSGRSDRKRSCAIQLNDSTVNVEPDEYDDDVFEMSPEGTGDGTMITMDRSRKEDSPSSEYGAVMHQRANFERTLSASVLERGEYAALKRDEPRLPAVPNVVYDLPTLATAECQVHSVAFGCISALTLAEEWERLGDVAFSHKYVIIDCRYPYEYDGGHLKHAINLHDNSLLSELFFPTSPPEEATSQSIMLTSSSVSSLESSIDTAATVPLPPVHKRIPIFYCEYSQKRGPRMAHDLRSMDRRRNIDKYPAVNFEVMYLLEKGYRNFFQMHSEKKPELFCTQRSYVEMDQKPKELGRYRAHRKRGRPHQVQKMDDARVFSPTTPGLPSKERRMASIVAREKIRDSATGRNSPITSIKSRLHFTDSDEDSPHKDKSITLKKLD